MNISKLSLLALIVAISAGGAVEAKDHGWKHKDKDHDRWDHDDHHDNRNIVIIERDRDFINNYYVTKYRSCPPGLRKKNAYCMPQGHYKRFTAGQYFPDYIALRPLPRTLAYGLSTAPQGTMYTYYNNDVYLIDALNRLILDVVFYNR